MKNKILLSLIATTVLVACNSGGGSSGPQYMTAGNYNVNSILGPAANSNPNNLGQIIGQSLKCAFLNAFIPIFLLQTTANVNESGTMTFTLIPTRTAQIANLNIKANPCGQFSAESDTYTFKNCAQIQGGTYQFLTYDVNQSPDLEQAGCDIYTTFTPMN